MKVLLLGGTGAMGSYLGRLLSDKGTETFITSRRERKNKGRINYIQGNAHDIAFLKTILINKYDAIIDFMSYNTNEFKERVNLLLDATSQYFFISTCRVYAESEDRITEDSPLLLDVCKDEKYLKTDEYALTKARQEKLLVDTGRKNWTIIRPPKTYGKDRLQLGCLEKEDWLQRALCGKDIIFEKEIASKILHLTNGYDLAQTMYAMIGREDAKGEAFHITTDDYIAWSDVLDLYLDILEKHLGKRPHVRYISLDKFKKYHNGEYQIKYSALFNRKFDNSKIAKFIDVSSFLTAQEGLKHNLEVFLENPKFNNRGRALVARQNILLREFSTKDCIVVVASIIKRIMIKIVKK